MSADSGWMLPYHPQSFDEITRDANGQKRAEHVPIRWPMSQAGRPPSAPPQKVNATCQEQLAENIKSEFVNDVVRSLVKL